MAVLPAALTCSGVGKSGSPALKSTTLTPSRRRRSASAAIFSVADGATCARRCANTIGIRSLRTGGLKASGYLPGPGGPGLRVRLRRSCPYIVACAPLSAHRLVLTAHPSFNGRRNQAADIATETEHFLDQARAQIRVLLRRHHEHRFERRLEMAIHQCHLKLPLEV